MKHLSYKELKKRYIEEKKALTPDEFILEFMKSLKNNNESEVRNLFSILKKRPDSIELAERLLMNTCCQDSMEERKEGIKMNCSYIITEMKELIDKPSTTMRNLKSNKVEDSKTPKHSLS